VSFEQTALPWLDDVYRFARSLTMDDAEADDVVQETFLRAFRSWGTFVPGSDCRRWLFTICRNAFLRGRERERHHGREVALEDGDAEALAGVRLHAQMQRSGEDRLIARLDLAPALARALGELQEPFRSVVVLVDVEEQSYEAAAAILGVPVGTVRSRLFRGRRLLQERLLLYAYDAGLAPTPPVTTPVTTPGSAGPA